MKTKYSFSHLLSCAAIVLVLASSTGQCEESDSPAKAPQKVDLDILRTLPVWHHGRVMPLDTLAKVTGETISGSGPSVKIQLEGYYTDEDSASEQFQPALEMIPGGE